MHKHILEPKPHTDKSNIQAITKIYIDVKQLNSYWFCSMKFAHMYQNVHSTILSKYDSDGGLRAIQIALRIP